MTITISPFVLGILCTIGAEILAFFLMILYYGFKNSLRKRRNAPNSSKEDKNE